MQSQHPASHLTAAKQRYLLALYRLQITGVKQADVANELGVSRASTYRMVHELIDDGYIQRRNRCEIYLSEMGCRVAEQLDDLYTTVSQYLLSNLDMEENRVREEALDLAMHMSPAFLEAMLHKIEDEQVLRQSKKQNARLSVEQWKSGCYQLPFQLLRQNEDRPSMGDKGFVHPCHLKIEDGHGWLELQLCDLSCHSVAARAVETIVVLRK